MKHFLFVFFVFTSLFLHAQSFYGGVRLGLTGTQVQGDNLSGFDKAGLSAGFIVGIPLGDYSTFQTELLFVQKGSRKNPTKNDASKYILRLNYVEMPFLYRRQLKKDFGFETGLSFGVLIKNTDVEYDLYGLLTSREPFEKIEISAHVGLWYLLNEKTRVNLRYSHSVLPVRPHQGGASYYFNKGQYNLVLALTLERSF